LEFNRPRFLEEVLEASHQYYLKTGKIKNYYIFVSLHDYPIDIKRKYQDYFSLIVDHRLYSYYSDCLPAHELKHQHKTKHFLSLNNRASVDRQSCYYFFKKYALLKKSYFSYIGDLDRTHYSTHQEISDLCTNGGTPWYMDALDLQQINQTIPFRIAGDAFKNNDWTTGQDDYYQQSFCSLVLETYSDQPYPCFSEKTFKPIAFGHPFLLHCASGSLNQLQQMGFQTFGDLWDESYDQLQGNDRLESIFRIVLDINQWSHEFVNQVYNNIQARLRHNRTWFFDRLPTEFKEYKQELYQQIAQIAQQQQKRL
jgi:hypothetical protein